VNFGAEEKTYMKTIQHSCRYCLYQKI